MSRRHRDAARRTSPVFTGHRSLDELSPDGRGASAALSPPHGAIASLTERTRLPSIPAVRARRVPHATNSRGVLMIRPLRTVLSRHLFRVLRRVPRRVLQADARVPCQTRDGCPRPGSRGVRGRGYLQRLPRGPVCEVLGDEDGAPVPPRAAQRAGATRVRELPRPRQGARGGGWRQGHHDLVREEGPDASRAAQRHVPVSATRKRRASSGRGAPTSPTTLLARAVTR